MIEAMRPWLLLVLVSSSSSAAPTARVDGEAVVWSVDGKESRFAVPGLASATLTLVPLRADGSDPLLWVSSNGGVGQLVRFGDSPHAIYSLAAGGGRPHLTSQSTRVWIVDVDGDGWNDIVEYATSRSDTGSEESPPVVRRYDQKSGRFVDDRALDRRAPRTPPWKSAALEKLAARALAGRSVESWGQLDGHSVALKAGAQGLAGGSPPWVGPDVLQLIMERIPGRALGGVYHLFHLRALPKLELVSSIKLGPVGFPVNGCRGRHEEFRREGDVVVVIWPMNGAALVEQRVGWDGKSLVAPKADPVSVYPCLDL